MNLFFNQYCMIFHKRGADIEYEYIFECYKRLYQESCDKDGYIANFDIIFANAIEAKNKKQTSRIEVEYEDYYSPDSIQHKVLDKIVNEPYITKNKKIHKLSSFEKQRIKNTVVMGIAPFSSFSAFCKRNPNFKKYKDAYISDLSDEDLTGIEEDN